MKARGYFVATALLVLFVSPVSVLAADCTSSGHSMMDCSMSAPGCDEARASSSAMLRIGIAE